MVADVDAVVRFEKIKVTEFEDLNKNVVGQGLIAATFRPSRAVHSTTL